MLSEVLPISRDIPPAKPNLCCQDMSKEWEEKGLSEPQRDLANHKSSTGRETQSMFKYQTPLIS